MQRGLLFARFVVALKTLKSAGKLALPQITLKSACKMGSPLEQSLIIIKTCMVIKNKSIQFKNNIATAAENIHLKQKNVWV